jgi:hypothetical protein
VKGCPAAIAIAGATRSGLCRTQCRGSQRFYPRLAEKIFSSLALRDPTQTNETIHLVVGDEGEPVIVAGDPAFVLELTLCKRRSGGRLLQERWSIDFQAFPASAGASASVDAPSTYEDPARHAATHFASSTCGGAIITTPQRRKVYWHCAGGFSRGYGKSES